MNAEVSGDDRTARFESHRRRLLSVGYRLTGSIAEAEDCVQDAWLRWQRTERDEVDNDEAFLVRTVSRLALDRLGSAPARRERYVGPFLPEPLVCPPRGGSNDPADAAVIADEVTFAMMVVLDRLSPDERVALVLHDVFGVGFDDISEMLDRSVESVRQLASRARGKAREDPDAPRPVPPADGEMMGRVLAAFSSGDIATVAELFSDDVVLTSDGGSDRHAARQRVIGPERVARLMVNIGKRDLPRARNVSVVDVGGAPSIWMELPDGPIVMMFDFDEAGDVRRVWSQLNPDKIHRDPWPTVV